MSQDLYFSFCVKGLYKHYIQKANLASHLEKHLHDTFKDVLRYGICGDNCPYIPKSKLKYLEWEEP